MLLHGLAAAQVLEQASHAGRQAFLVAHADVELALGPRIAQRQQRQPHHLQIVPGDAFRYHGQAQAFAHHPAAGFEVRDLRLHGQRAGDRARHQRQERVERMARKVAEEVVVQGFLEPQRALRLKRMAARHHQSDAVLAVRQRVHARARAACVIDTNIGVPTGHHAWDIKAERLDQVDTGVGVVLEKAADIGGQKLQNRRPVRGQPDLGDAIHRVGGQRILGQLHAAHDGLGALIQHGACRCRLHASPVASQQRRARASLQFGDAFAGGRRDEVLALGRA